MSTAASPSVEYARGKEPDLGSARREAEERAIWLQRAHDAVGALRVLVAPYRDHVAYAESSTAAKQSHAVRQTALRRFSDDLVELRQQYIDMHSSDDPHARGKAFETVLRDLF